MTIPKRGEWWHERGFKICRWITVDDGFEPAPHDHPASDCPALKQETCGFMGCIWPKGHQGEPGSHSTPQEPKAEPLEAWFTDHPLTREWVEVHTAKPCQRERERLRGLIRHSLMLSPPNFDPKTCFQCREIEEALK